MRLLPFWTDLALLAMASSRVVALRTLRLASADGAAACQEAQRMWCEKMHAHAEAATTLMGGGSVAAVIAGYREVVDANAARLAGGADRRSRATPPTR